jgi:16S rRNA G966 N2-methylase RsmD
LSNVHSDTESIRTLLIDSEFSSLIPPLRPDERAGLERSILEDGVRDPLVVWNGTIVDGHNRYEIASGNNVNGEVVEFKTVEKNFADRNEVKIWIIENQLEHRRNLSEVRRISLNLKREEFYRAQAKERQGTRSDLNSTSGAIAPEVEKDDYSGRTVSKIARDAYTSPDKVKKHKKIAEKAPELLDRIDVGEESYNSAYKEVNKQEKREKKQRRKDEAAEKMKGVEFDERLRILHGGFEEILADELENTVDFVFTDPPYGVEHLHLWDKLGKFAHDHLKDDGFLAAYSGQMLLPEVIDALREAGLTYYWTIAVQNTHGQLRFWNKTTWNSWKPIFLFAKGEPREHEWFIDLLSFGEAETKEHHEWAQPLGQARELINKFTMPGDVVVDPMCGSGTIPIAAFELDRYGIGCELDESRYEEAKRKVVELMPEAVA